MEKALYQVISENLVDGRLPREFSLPNESSGGIAYADGAQDSIVIHHREPGHQVAPEYRALAEKAVELISDGEIYQAEDVIWQLATEIGALDLHDCLRQYIIANAARLNARNLFNFALSYAVQCPNREGVKIALSILSAFNTEGEPKAYIRTLGLSDEFTLFVATVMSNWDNENEEYFNLAQKVQGWGRINLVHRILPETEEIRRWLLREGVHNTVMPAYSALECWVKADVPSVLAGEISREDFCGIRDIIEALLEERAVKGISMIPHAEVPMRAFLEQAGRMRLDDHDWSVIEAIHRRFSSDPGVNEAFEILSKHRG